MAVLLCKRAREAWGADHDGANASPKPKIGCALRGGNVGGIKAGRVEIGGELG